ncbi:hypothetical protein CFC21_099629 [Triticum aestivum]|uniref:MATH domain-containing protein n=2 Tax=Triticum aestivum TaxID=4565 RepID=A0A9R1N249_WHEAT|nr:hypothetical protein CFC21_099629 [Triticum aestivum]
MSKSNTSASSVGASRGGSSVSASAIVAPVVESGSHILRIDGYSRTKGLGKGEFMASETFAAGGSLEAKYTISLLDQDGNLVPSYSDTGQDTFEAGSDDGSWGFDLIKRSELEESVYLKDDVFFVRCDVTVFKEKMFTKAVPVPEVFRAVIRQD